MAGSVWGCGIYADGLGEKWAYPSMLGCRLVVADLGMSNCDTDTTMME